MWPANSQSLDVGSNSSPEVGGVCVSASVCVSVHTYALSTWIFSWNRLNFPVASIV